MNKRIAALVVTAAFAISGAGAFIAASSPTESAGPSPFSYKPRR